MRDTVILSVFAAVAIAAFAILVWLYRRRSTTRMVQVYEIPVSKEKLRAMPIEERGFLLSLGYSANHVSMLQKLLRFSLNTQPDVEAEKLLSAAQSQMLLRLLIGALHETWVLINGRFLGKSLGETYSNRLDEKGRAALETLEKMFDESKLLTIVRNNFSFHFPSDKVLQAAFDDACNNSDSDDLWRFYFSHYGLNSLFLVSDLMAIHGVGRLIKENDVAVAQERMMKEVRMAVDNTFEFTTAFFAAAWLKNFGSTIDAKTLINVPNAPAIQNVIIPFFVDMDAT
jgi:hypothetical protein